MKPDRARDGDAGAEGHPRERVLVTGSGGYIGTTLVPLLLERGYAVRALDRFFFGRDLLAPHEHLEVVREDTRRIRPEHLARVDHVIDLAALSNDPTGETFGPTTWEVNHRARARTSRLAKAARVRRYVLPSSCSIYGWQDPDKIVDETSPTQPLTTYAQANLRAEEEVRPLAGDGFCVVVVRQATVYGCSPRMRFDLAINGMTYGAWKTGRLPLMRDGTQWRPMVHVMDAAEALAFMLTAPVERISGEIFNVGSEQNNYQIGPLGRIVADVLPRPVEIEWYGDPDERSYRVNFQKIEALGWHARRGAEDGAREVYEALEAGTLAWTPRTITLEWYTRLVEWHRIIRETELDGAMLEL